MLVAQPFPLLCGFLRAHAGAARHCAANAAARGGGKNRTTRRTAGAAAGLGAHRAARQGAFSHGIHAVASQHFHPAPAQLTDFRTINAIDGHQQHQGQCDANNRRQLARKPNSIFFFFFAAVSKDFRTL